MKKCIFVWALLIGFILWGWSKCFAEVYLCIKSDTKEIITASEKNDTLPQTGQEIVTLKGNLDNYELDEHITNYFYKSKFILNTKKISDVEKAKEETIAKENKRKEDKQKAIDKLVALGLTDDEILALTGGN